MIGLPPQMVSEQKVPSNRTIPIGFLNDLNSAETEDHVSEVFTKWASELIGANRCAIARRIGQNDLHVQTSLGRRKGRATRHPIADTLLGEAVLSKQFTVISDLENQPYEGCRVLAAAGMEAIIIAPILSGTDCFGVISATYRKDCPHSNQDQQVLKILANCLANHIDLLRKVGDLEVLVRTDPLTGAFNRHFYEDRARQLWHDWSTMGRPFSIASVDLDHFKLVNDTMGHAIGDEVLCEVVRRLRNRLRPGDTIVRMGGEEFCILLGGVSSDVATPLVHRLHEVINSEAIRTSDGPVAVTASIGIASPQHIDEDTAQVLKRSDAALYYAKSNGRNQIILQSEIGKSHVQTSRNMLRSANEHAHARSL